MKRWLIVAALLLIIAASVFWLLVSVRLLAVPFFLAFVISLFVRSCRARPMTVAGAWLVFFAVTWLPFDITLRAAPGGPKFVRCCPGSPYRDYQGALQKQRRGECVLCSDVVFGFEPRYYLVW
jgi:hypothetical protein